MKRVSLAIVLFIALSLPLLADVANFKFQKVGDDVYAAIAEREFSGSQFQSMPGFSTFFDANFRRAYNELKELR
jgi:hypothetical protein